MSLHYLVKNEIAICGTQSVVIAMSATLIKILRHTVKTSKKVMLMLNKANIQNVVPWHEHTPGALSAIHQ